MSTCKHEFKHLHTNDVKIRGGYLNSYERREEFYCTKCCHVLEKVTKRVDSRSAPDWYNGKD